MLKFRNSKRRGRWLFKLGSKQRRFRLRSKKPGKWKLKFLFGSKKPKKKIKKYNKHPKMKKQNKMSKMRKMRKMW